LRVERRREKRNADSGDGEAGKKSERVLTPEETESAEFAEKRNPRPR